MSGRRTLVTGSAGFVGAALVRRLLADGHHVEAIVRPQSDRWRIAELRNDITTLEVDLRDRDAVRTAIESADPEWIFHCAAHGAYSWQADPRSIFESNVIGTSNLAEACVGHGFDAFIQAGSSSEYGLKDHAPSEDELPEPNSDYAVAKVAATMLCRHLAERHGLHMATLRLYSVYGPWEDPRRLMPTLVAHGLRGMLPPLVASGIARDFVHVDDVCSAFLLAAQAHRADAIVYNVGSGRQTTIGELIRVARHELKIPAEPQWGSHGARRWDTDRWMANPARIEAELGWRPRQTLVAGLRHMADWLLANPLLWDRYSVART